MELGATEKRNGFAVATPWGFLILTIMRWTLSLMVLDRSNAGGSFAFGLPWEKPHIDRTEKRTRYAAWLFAYTDWKDNG